VNAFAIGFGSVPVAAFAAWLLVFATRPPGPVHPGVLAAILAVAAGGTFVILWLGVRGALLALKDRDIRADFRAADPRGWRSAAAGVLSGLAGVAPFLGAILLGGPGETERNVVVPWFFALGLGCLTASPFVGAAIFFSLFLPRSAPPAPPD
jgi:hypothetical protein